MNSDNYDLNQILDDESRRKVKQATLKYLKKNEYVIHGDFVNEFGEEFLVYGKIYSNGMRKIYVTGDELNWEIGWSFNNRKILKQEFELNEEEFDMIKDIIEKSNGSDDPKKLGKLIARRLQKEGKNK